MKNRTFFILILALSLILYLCACSSVKKVITKQSKSVDSLVVENKTIAQETAVITQINTSAKDTITKETESGYEAVNVDSGYSIIYPVSPNEYFEKVTTKKTKIFLPKVKIKEQTISIKKDSSTITDLQVIETNYNKSVAVKKEEKAVYNNTSKNRILWAPVLIGCGILFIFFARKFKLF